uniref:Uncharacterized protein n=1 Tax=Panstrongylus lignarius TaxID=156445 RepID=A0A224Y322_9HEMI
MKLILLFPVLPRLVSLHLYVLMRKPLWLTEQPQFFGNLRQLIFWSCSLLKLISFSLIIFLEHFSSHLYCHFERQFASNYLH